MTFKLFPSMRLGTRVVLVVIALLIAGVWGLAARVAALVQADLGNELMQSMSATVRFVVADLDSDIQLRVNVLNGIAASITPGVVGDPAKIAQILQQSQGSEVLFPLGLIATNKDGTYIAAYPPVSAPPRDSLRDTDLYRQIMAGARQAIGTLVTGAGAGQPLVRVGVPLRDASGAAVGVLYGTMISSDASLLGHLEQAKIGKNGFISVYSPKDRLIVSSADRDGMLYRLPAKGVNSLRDWGFEDGFEGPGVSTTSAGFEVLTMARRMDTTGWVVLAATPTAQIFAPIAALKRQIYFAALLISLAVAAMLGLVLARQLAPLKKAADAMRRMTEGEAPLAAIEVVRQDEIGDLIASFNQLAAERIRLDAALRGEVDAHKRSEEALDQALTRLQALSERMTRVQEQEHRKIAFELHEQAGQELSALMIHLQLLTSQCGGKEAQANLQSARTIAAMALERVRAMSLDLHPRQLDELGLCVALRGYCGQQAEVAGWIMHVDVPQTRARPPREVEIACFRVLQEALANVARHANASEVWVSLRQSDSELQLSVRDNGCGFDVGGHSARSGHAGIGLTAIAERVRQVDGRMDISSSPGSGTEIQVRVFFNSGVSG